MTLFLLALDNATPCGQHLY